MVYGLSDALSNPAGWTPKINISSVGESTVVFRGIGHGLQDETSNLCGFCPETTMIGQILLIIIKLKLKKATLGNSFISSSS